MRDETAEGLPEGSQNVSGDLQPINMDPGSVIPVPDQVRDDGSGTGVTDADGTRVESGLILSFPRKQSLPRTRSGESMFIGTRRRKTLRKGRKPPGSGEISRGVFSRSKWTPGRCPG
jgi:hypothetical protein